MNEWLNNLEVGDSVVIRDSAHLITAEGPTESVGVVKEITGEYIKTLPLEHEPKLAPTIEPFKLFTRRFGSSNSAQLVRESS